MAVKKGVFYTLTALLFLAIIIFSVFFYQGIYKYREHSQLQSIRILQMNHLLKNIDRDIERAIYIASFRSFLAMQQNLVSKGTYYSDVSSSFLGLFLNGTLDNASIPLMNGSTINDWFTNLNQRISVNGLNIQWKVLDVGIFQSDPWAVTTRLGLDYVLTDSAGTASWNLSRNFTAVVSITDFEDPIYIIETNGKLSNILTRSNVTDFVQGADTSNLQTHLLNSWYVWSDQAPSYLMRLGGNFSSSPFGIESMVNLALLSDQGIQPLDKSVIDYIYFSGQAPAKFSISGMPAWFRLDNETLFSTKRLIYYEVGGLVQ